MQRSATADCQLRSLDTDERHLVFDAITADLERRKFSVAPAEASL